MSNYTKQASWLDVDKSGNTIYASNFDDEFTAIATAIATKGDTSAVTDAGLSGLFDVEVFTSDGTWTKPPGVKKVFVRVLAGGGGGCGGGSDQSGGGGGAGGAYISKSESYPSVAFG